MHSSLPHHLLPLNQNHDAKLLLAVFPPRAVLPKRRRGKIAEDDGAEEEGEEDEDHLRREEHVLRRVLPRDEAAGVVAEVLQEQQIRKTHWYERDAPANEPIGTQSTSDDAWGMWKEYVSVEILQNYIKLVLNTLMYV